MAYPTILRWADEFDRHDGDPRNGWSAGPGAALIENELLVSDRDGVDLDAIQFQPVAADQDVAVEWDALTTEATCVACAPTTESDAFTYYMFRQRASGQDWQIYFRDAGTFNLIGSVDVGVGETLGPGRRRLVVTPTTVEGWDLGPIGAPITPIKVLDIADVQLPRGGFAGCRQGAVAATWDNFELYQEFPTTDGCEIANTGGWRTVIEILYNPDGIRRFGSENFGDGVFGGGEGEGLTRWVDVTPAASDMTTDIARATPSMIYPADICTFDIYDPEGSFMGWLPPYSLSSPQLGDFVRTSLVAPNQPGLLRHTFVGQIDSVRETAVNVDRRLTIRAVGALGFLATPLYYPDRPKETIQERFEWVLNEIDYVGSADYPASFATLDLEQDQNDREGPRAWAIAILREAANSAGYSMWADRNGNLQFGAMLIPDTAPVEWLTSDCDLAAVPGTFAISNTITYSSDAQAVLNVVQFINTQFSNRSVEAKDPVSIGLFGRRADGYGFPLDVANQNKTDLQPLADALVAQTAYIVNRVEAVQFSTLTDPRWFTIIENFAIRSRVDVVRQHPRTETFQAVVIGADVRYTSVGLSGTIYLTSLNTTI